MFWIFKKKVHDPTLLEEAITEALTELKSYSAIDKEYPEIVKNIKELHEMQMAETPKRRVSSDAIATIAGNLLGIGLIISHERVNVITTKALGFITKPKI